jgi:aryl-alcohol dehydrogenase-like predicted oxidoreductase
LKNKTVQHITLRHTDLTVSRICLGTMTFGGQTDVDEAARTVDYCLDFGVNFFDTANIYNKGASETILGRVLRNRRSSVILASKVRGKMGDGPNESGLSRSAILRAVDDTLRRLGTDYLDLYYLHQPDYDAPLEESLDAIDRLVRLGKVRWPASSNYASWQVCRMLWLAETHSYKPARVTQPMYNLIARGIEHEYLPMAKEFGVSTVVYNPLAGGLLTGKQRREAPIPGTRFDNNQLYLDRYWHPAYFDAVDRLGAIAASVGRSLVSLALNWLLHHSPADCLILGASRLNQISENLRAAEEGPLPEDIVAACDKVWADLRGITPKYNR